MVEVKALVSPEMLVEVEVDAIVSGAAAAGAQAARGARGGLTLKVSEKGALSVYGLGRFRSRSTRSSDALLDASAELREFMTENDARLKTKESATSRRRSRTSA